MPTAPKETEKQKKEATAKKKTTESEKKVTAKDTKKQSSTSSKKSSAPAKNSSTKKTVNVKNVSTKKVIDPRTGRVVVAGKKNQQTEKITKTSETAAKKIEEKKAVRKKIVKKSSKELTIEVPRKEPEPLVRPTPKKTKELTKEEKALYKQLDEAFTFIANMTCVIEDRTMDRKTITDLAIGELHVIETVNKNNNKPMTLIAKKEHVTVGALTTCVNRLVQKGYLLRTRDEMDHRVILLSVTQKAKKVLKAHDKFHDDILGLALEGVNLTQATKVLTQFAHILEVYYDPTLLEEKVKKTKKK